MAESRLSQEGRDEPEYRKPRLALEWPHLLLAHPLNGVRRLSPECQPSITGDIGHPGLAASKGLSWEKSPHRRGIMLSPREESRTKTLRETEEQDRLRAQQEETEGKYLIHFSHYVNSPRLSVASEES